MGTIAPEALEQAAVVDLWLRDRPDTTRRSYLADLKVLRESTSKPIFGLTTSDLQRFAAELAGSTATRARRISSVKSLMAFAHRLGAIAMDPARDVRPPKNHRDAGERVLTDGEVAEVIREAQRGRDRVLLRTLYISGIRVAEAVGLRWRDVGQRWISVMGKGARRRTVLVPKDLTGEIRRLRSTTDLDDAFVFRGRGRRALSTGQARRIARRAGMEAVGRPVTPHWFRHSHACHAIEHGVPLHVLMTSLGHSNLTTTAAYLHVRPDQGSSQYLLLRNTARARSPSRSHHSLRPAEPVTR